MANKGIDPGPKKKIGAFKQEYRFNKKTGKITEVKPAAPQTTQMISIKEYRFDKKTGKKTEVKRK